MLALAVLVLAGVAALAQPPTAVTRISLTRLHCNGCLNTIAAEVNKVTGVAATSGDLKAKVVYVTHRAGMSPSPRALWEAVVEADHTPTRIETPEGVWTKKPPR
jgi:copper chaperone CopZ